MLEAMTIGISIGRNWREVYETVWRPQDFARWASGLSRSVLVEDGATWIGEGPRGRIRVWFTGHNPFGVMDHRVQGPDGATVDVPLRVVRNEDGAEVLLTLFRQPGTSDDAFAADAEWVRRDLLALKALVTR